MKPNIIVFPGSNCDRDIHVAIKKTTGQNSKMIWHKETSLDNPNLILLLICHFMPCRKCCISIEIEAK